MTSYQARPERISVDHKRACEKLADPSKMANRELFANAMTARRARSIDKWYEQGGRLFVAWSKKYYRRWTGEPLDFDRDPFIEEVLMLMGLPWLEELSVEKAAQVGFTEYGIAYAAFCLSYVRITIGFGFERAAKLADIVGPRVQRAFDNIQPIQELKTRYRQTLGRKDTDTKQRNLSVGGVAATFFYAGVNSSGAKGGEEREVSSSMSSFEAFTIVGDEADAWPPGTRQTARERTGACTMPTAPVRFGSTPGSDAGAIASMVKSSGYLFEWQVVCPGCGKKQALYPMGNFLKSVLVVEEDGTEEERFIDDTGRPLNWFYRDGTNQESKIRTAYIGCRYCEAELPYAESIERVAKGGTGHYACSNTGKTLIEVHDDAVRNKIVIPNAGLRLPRLASPRFKPSARIRACVESDNPMDSLQQGLGLAISLAGGAMRESKLLDCVGLPVPDEAKDWETVLVLGVDQGQSHHWGVLTRWYLPPEKDKKQRWLKAFKEIVCYEKIYKFEGIEEFARKHDVDIVGIDVDPETEKATDYSEEHKSSVRKKGRVFALNQVAMKGGKVRRSTPNVQGKDVVVYSLHRTWGLDAIRTRIYRKQQSFPAGMMIDKTDFYNPLYHYLTSERRSDETWSKPESAPDHFMHADNFTEAALWADLFEERRPGLIISNVRT